jgi:hypothetical protein
MDRTSSRRGNEKFFSYHLSSVKVLDKCFNQMLSSTSYVQVHLGNSSFGIHDINAGLQVSRSQSAMEVDWVDWLGEFIRFLLPSLFSVTVPLELIKDDPPYIDWRHYLGVV